MKLEYKGFILHKTAESFGDCADNIACSHHCSDKLIKFAIADGISKSFLPKIWSKNLVDEYVRHESIDYDFVQIAELAQQEWGSEFKSYIQALRDNGERFTDTLVSLLRSGYAGSTLVGLTIYKKDDNWYWRSSALGDSLVIFFPSDSSYARQICTSLKKDVANNYIFDNYPDYFRSRAQILDDNDKYQTIDIKYGEINDIWEQSLTSGKFVLATDALAEFLLNNENILAEVIEIKEPKEFEEFIVKHRNNSQLKDDDSSLIHIDISTDNSVDEFICLGWYDSVYHHEEVPNITCKLEAGDALSSPVQ